MTAASGAGDPAVEVVARHLFATAGSGRIDYNELLPHVRTMWLNKARAVLAALRSAVGAADVDELAEVIRAAIEREAAVWEVSFDGGQGLVVGVPDAAYVATRAVLDRLAVTGGENGVEADGGAIAVIEAALDAAASEGRRNPAQRVFTVGSLRREARRVLTEVAAAAAPVPVAAGDEAVNRG